MTDLAWRDLGGTGDPFLLIHGYTGSSDDFIHVVGPLTELRRILVVDLHGHGNSPRLESYTADLIRAAVVGFIGEVVGLRESLRWFDNRPLFGKRVLVTRTAAQAGAFGELLVAEGAEPLSCPVIVSRRTN